MPIYAYEEESFLPQMQSNLNELIITESSPEETSHHDGQFEDGWQPAFDEDHHEGSHVDGEKTVSQQTGALEEGPT